MRRKCHGYANIATRKTPNRHSNAPASSQTMNRQKVREKRLRKKKAIRCVSLPPWESVLQFEQKATKLLNNARMSIVSSALSRSPHLRKVSFVLSFSCLRWRIVSVIHAYTRCEMMRLCFAMRISLKSGSSKLISPPIASCFYYYICCVSILQYSAVFE